VSNSKLEISIRPEKLYCLESKTYPAELSQTATMTVTGKQFVEKPFGEGFPCILYECNAALEITFVTPNVTELINLEASSLLGTRAFSHNRVFREDADSVLAGLRDLSSSGATSFVHRVTDETGLPKWVAHSLHKVAAVASESYRGCIIPIDSEQFSRSIERSVISRFVHKIGNHFQLLMLLVNPLRKLLPDSKEVEVFDQTVEKAVELTRAFSDYTQGAACFVEFDLGEMLNGIIDTRKASFAEKGVNFDVRMSESASRVIIRGDPFLLDTAINSILQNALEATERAGNVVFRAKLEKCRDGNSSALNLIVEDSGSGIQKEHLSKIAEPFFTSKKNRDGLGLSMASRFIEIHGGAISIESQEGKGTKVEIALPIVNSAQGLDR
jgi:hypothetical protein